MGTMSSSSSSSSPAVAVIFALTLLFGLVLADDGSSGPLGDGDDDGDGGGAFLMPGTNFCGKGWRAARLDQLGAFGAADKCCRQHDLGCPSAIAPMTSKYGLYNWRPYTAMHCSCDDRFRTCLKLSRSSAADTVGNIFFNVIKTTCFVFSREKVCTEREWWGGCKKKEWKKVAKWRGARAY